MSHEQPQVDPPNLLVWCLAILLFPAIFWGQFWLWKALPAEVPVEPLAVGLGLTSAGLLALALRNHQAATLETLNRYRAPLLLGVLLAVTGFHIARYASVAPFLPYDYDSRVNMDTFALDFQAKVFSEGKLWAEAPGASFDTLGVVQFEGRWFGRYPPLTPLYFALGERLLKDPRPLAILLPLLAALLAGLLASEFFGASAGYLAAALWLVSKEALVLFPTVRSNPVAAVLLLVGAWAAVKLAKSGRPGWALLVALALVLQLNNRAFDGLIMALGLGVYALLLLKPSRRVGLRLGLATLAGIGFGFAVMLGVNHLYTGDVLTAPFQLFSPKDLPGFGPRQHSPETTLVNYTPADMLPNVLAPFNALWRTYTPLGILLLALAWPRLWRKHKAETGLLLAFVLGLAVYGLHWFPSPRYGMVVAPFVGVFVAGACLGSSAKSWWRLLLGLFLVAHFWITPSLTAVRCNLSPVAQPAELALLEEARSAPALVFLSPATTLFEDMAGHKKISVARVIGRPNTGLGALLPSPTLNSPLVVALDRGAVANAEVIRRLPGRRVLLAVYGEEGSVTITPYSPEGETQ